MDMYQKRKKRQEMKNSENKKETQNQMNINWYPGHMAKTKRLIKENINLIDIIYEVIDARIPFSSKIQDIDDIIGNKPRILIMTKYGLCDKSETEKFVNTIIYMYQDYIQNEEVGKYANILSKCSPRIVSQNILVLDTNFSHIASKVKIKANQKGFSELISKIYGKSYYFYFL